MSTVTVEKRLDLSHLFIIVNIVMSVPDISVRT